MREPRLQNSKHHGGKREHEHRLQRVDVVDAHLQGDHHDHGGCGEGVLGEAKAWVHIQEHNGRGEGGAHGEKGDNRPASVKCSHVIYDGCDVMSTVPYVHGFINIKGV